MSEQIIKRHVHQELPDESRLREHGIAVDLELARLVLSVVSRMIVHGRANHRNGLCRAMRGIGLAVSLDLEDEDGIVIPGLIGRPSGVLAPDGSAAARELGVLPSAFNNAWSDGPVYVTSCLPLEVALAFLPGPSWRRLAVFIAAGPHDARARLSQAASQRGKTMTWKALEAQFAPAQTLMTFLVGLLRDFEGANKRRSEARKAPLAIPAALEGWTFVPAKLSTDELKSKAQGGRKLPTSAVPEELVQARLRELARNAEWGKWAPGEWPVNRNWKALKRLALFALLAAIAPRGEHLANLDVRDVVVNCTFRDGTFGHALLFRGGDRGLKNRRDTYEYAVRLPEALFYILVAWIRCNGGEPCLAARSGDTPRSYSPPQPLFPTRRKRSAADQQKPHDRLGNFVGGRTPSATSPAASPLLADPNGSGRGFQAHRFRSTLTQGVDRLMKTWCRENANHQLAGYPDDSAAECILDHTHQDLGYRDFRDGDNPSARFEEITAVGVSLWWEELWGDGPYVCRGLDADAITQSHERVRTIEAQIEMVEHETAELQKQSTELVRRALERAHERDQVQALLQSNALRDERDEKLQQRDALKERLKDALAALTLACQTEVLLPEDVDPETHAITVAKALAALRDEPVTEKPAVADRALALELTTADVAELYGISSQQVGRWRRGLSSPPVPPEQWVECNKKDFRLPVSAIDDAALQRVPSGNPGLVLENIRARRAILGYARRPSHYALTGR